MSEELAFTNGNNITLDDVASAEKLIGLNFTDTERSQLLEKVNEQTQHYEQLRSLKLDNSVTPPLYFNPQVPSDYTKSADHKTQRVYHLSPLPSLKRPANLEDVAFYPLTHLAELIRTGQITSLELTEMYLSRLKRYDPLLHCVITLTEDLAYQQAQRADEEIQTGLYRSPLHGIPWGAKDLFNVRDYPTTWGAEPYRHQTFENDATIVQNLEAVGAVLIAKLTLGALAYRDLCFDTRTRNPWNLDEGSSGSSAGSASAVSAGLVGFAIGTETLGSIVSPATRCGVTGLRPTFGRVSRYGSMALSWSMDKIGPMARSVEDCALILTAIYGADGQDLAVTDSPFEWNPDSTLSSIRVGYVFDAFEQATDNDQAVLKTLHTLGNELIPIALPKDDLSFLSLILQAEAAAAFDELTRNDQDDLLTWQDKEAWPNSFRAARFITAVEYLQANRNRTLLMQKMADLMQIIDVFVVPTFAANALLITNLTGHPCVAVPNGFTDVGTPTSITFIGNLYREAELLMIAKAYQDATEFHLKYPPIFS